jgi:cyclopropane fatty-acyl-phospholipid synthase-like methyltransferase
MRALSQTHRMLVVSEACERNKGPILAVLAAELAVRHAVLEIGSGTGQHAVHFATHLPYLTWQPSEMRSQLAPLIERLRREAPPNVRAAIALDVHDDPWPAADLDAVFSANTLHIMAWSAVREFFRGSAAVLRPGGVVCVYGPMRYRGEYTSASNAQFDQWLKERDPQSGIRDFEALDALAGAHGLQLRADHAMPANNQTVVWHRPA